MNTSPPLPRARLDNRAAANYLGLSPSFLNKSRIRGDGPDYIKAGVKVLYDVADLDRWLAARRRASTSGAPHAA